MYIMCYYVINRTVYTFINKLDLTATLESYITLDRRQSKTLILSMNLDKISLESEFSIAISHPTGDKLGDK